MRLRYVILTLTVFGWLAICWLVGSFSAAQVTPVPSPTPIASASPSATPTAGATYTPSPTATTKATPTAIATPIPTASAIPSPTPTSRLWIPCEFNLPYGGKVVIPDFASAIEIKTVAPGLTEIDLKGTFNQGMPLTIIVTDSVETVAWGLKNGC